MRRAGWTTSRTVPRWTATARYLVTWQITALSLNPATLGFLSPPALPAILIFSLLAAVIFSPAEVSTAAQSIHDNFKNCEIRTVKVVREVKQLQDWSGFVLVFVMHFKELCKEAMQHRGQEIEHLHGLKGTGHTFIESLEKRWEQHLQQRAAIGAP